MAASITADNDTFDAIGSPEHSTRKINTPLGEKYSNLRRADSLPADLHFVDLVSEEAEFFAHLAEKSNISTSILAECKSFTKVNLFRMQPVANYFGQEVLGRKPRELTGKRNY